MPALHQTSIPRLHAQPPRTIAHQIPSSQAGPLRLTPDSDGPDPGLAPDLRACLAYGPQHGLAPRHLLHAPVIAGPGTQPPGSSRPSCQRAPCSRFDSDDSDALPHSPRSPHGRQAPRPNPHRCSARAASHLAETAVRLGCHLYAMGAYDRWATSPSRAALPEPPSPPASGKPLDGGHPTARARRRWGGSTPTTQLLSVWGYYGVQSPRAA